MRLVNGWANKEELMSGRDLFYFFFLFDFTLSIASSVFIHRQQRARLVPVACNH